MTARAAVNLRNFAGVGLMLRVLNVAEKPSVAKEASRILSQGTARFAHTWSCSSSSLHLVDLIKGSLPKPGYTLLLKPHQPSYRAALATMGSISLCIC